MNKKLIVIIPIILVIVVGALFYFQSRQSTNNTRQEVVTDQKTGPESTVVTTPKSVVKKLESASAFANKVLKYNQSSDFGKMYDLICPADRAGATKTEYVKAMVGVWGNVRIVSFTVKDALEEPNGATVQFVMNTSDSQTQNDLFTLEKNNNEWCFRSSITGLVAQVKYYQNIKLVVNSFDKPYHPPYTTIEAGQEGVRINISVTNTGDKTLACHSGDGSERECQDLDFLFKDSGGGLYESKYLSGAEMPKFKLAPGATVTGSIGFKIPAGTSGYKIVFRDFGYGADITEASAGF